MTSEETPSTAGSPLVAADAATSAQPDWNAIRFAYEETPEPIHAIAKRFGVTRDAINWRKKIGRWRARGRGRLPNLTIKTPDPLPVFATLLGGAPSLATTEGRKDFTKRLYDAINWTFHMAEKQTIANPDAPEAVHTIKAAVETAARDTDKVDRIDARTQKSAAAEQRQEQPWYECADEDQFRSELARRLAALCEQWESEQSGQ